jgi:alpha-L-fucosidase
MRTLHHSSFVIRHSPFSKLLPVLASAFLLGGCASKTTPPASPAASSSAPATASTPSADDGKQWFREARFGMFIHWGVYAVPAGVYKDKPIGGIGEWIMNNAPVPVAEYRTYAKDFTAANYDPAAWAALAKEAGMKYVVITSKHHDGFALYDSAASDWDVGNPSCPAPDDLLTPLAKNVRAQGLKFGLYYSQAQDWTHKGGGKYRKNWDPAQEGDFDAYLRDLAIPQVKEILTRFQPDIVWWDTPAQMNTERAQPIQDLLTAHPSIITNNRLGGGFEGDTKTPEQHIPPRGFPGQMFEVCMTMNDTWGFKKTDHNWKSTRQIIHNLSDISSKGGNFLLNVGPTADGRIPEPSIERLKAVGRWMKVNSEAIYATQPSPFARRLPWGRVTQKVEPSGATTLFLHVWEWPADGRLLLPTLQATPRSARVLADGRKVKTTPSADGLVVNLTGTAPDPDVSVVVLKFKSPVTVTQSAFATPEADGTLTLHPMDADTHGSYGGNLNLYGTGTSAILTHWLDAVWRVEYQLKTPAARTWRVTAEVAAPDATKLTLRSGKTEVPVDLAPTGPGKTWKTVDLGTIALPGGQTSLELVPVKGEWKPIELRTVRLTPVP